MSDSKQRSADALKQLKVLYVEDEAGIREEVAYFLQRHVGQLLTAANGESGLESFRSQRPDLVLTDIQMPRVDGLSMAAEIKAIDREIPIIVTTAFNEIPYLHRALSLGINGYVVKPINLEGLLQRILHCVDLLTQSRDLTTSRAQLAAYHQAAEAERQLVADLMARMMHPENLRDSQVRYWLRPTEIVCGDLVAVARNRNNKLFIMLADSTGHGLPAALNLLPINHIFHRMVGKGLPLSLMVEEMNWAVREQSPTERYVCALLACIDLRNRVVEFWNGGLPGALLIADDGHVIQQFESSNFPLGILDKTFVAQTDIVQWSEPGDLFLYSDGLEDVENEAGKPLGPEFIMRTLRETPRGERFDILRAAAEAHLGARNSNDDITLIQVMLDAPNPYGNSGQGGHHA